MKDVDTSSRLIIELATLLLQEMRAMGQPWEKAFLRSEFRDGVQTHKLAVVRGASGQVLDPARHQPLFSRILSLVPDLREALMDGPAGFCVALMAVDPESNYDMQYEFDDASRWAIANTGDARGVPAGYVGGA